MLSSPDIARVAALVADDSRARMLMALMDGRAMTATELAVEADVSPSTASSHISKLSVCGLITTATQGRHRYFRLSGPDVATALEGLMGIAPQANTPRRVFGPADPDIRVSRVCYDHLAGEAAVQMLDRLRATHLIAGARELVITPAGETWCHKVGIDLAPLRRRRRPLCRPCLDWSERRTHLGGALGAAILDRLLTLRYAHKETGSRILTLSPRGRRFVETLALR